MTRASKEKKNSGVIWVYTGAKSDDNGVTKSTDNGRCFRVGGIKE